MVQPRREQVRPDPGVLVVLVDEDGQFATSASSSVSRYARRSISRPASSANVTGGDTDGSRRGRRLVSVRSIPRNSAACTLRIAGGLRARDRPYGPVSARVCRQYPTSFVHFMRTYVLQHR